MKKVLFATTALIATASVAAADVTFSGYGRFGLIYVDPNGGTDSTDITSRLRMQIDATAESDGGVEAGARIRIEQEERDDGLGTINGARFFVRAGGLEVGVGNIFGALEFMPGQYDIDLGLTGHTYDYTVYNFRGDAYSSAGTGGSGSNGVEMLYSIGDFSFHVSASEGDDQGPGGNNPSGVSRVAGVAAYSFSGFTAAVGYQDSNRRDDNGLKNDTEWTVSFGGDIGPVFASIAYADNRAAGDQFVIQGRYDIGASTNIEAYYADRQSSVAVEGGELVNSGESYGIDFNHSLGGGVSLRGGVSSTFDDDTYVDFGLRFNF